MAFGSFSSLFIALCSSSDVAVYITCTFLGFASCLHSLSISICLAYTSTAFKESKTNVPRSTCFCSNFSNEHYPVPIHFHLNQLRNFPAKTYRSVKRVLPSHSAREGNRLISGLLSSQSAYAIA